MIRPPVNENEPGPSVTDPARAFSVDQMDQAGG